MLPDSKINISLPKIIQRPHPLLRSEEFIPCHTSQAIQSDQDQGALSAEITRY